MTSDEIHADYRERMGAPLGTFMFHLQNDVHWLHRKWLEFNELFGPNAGHSDLLNQVASNFFYYLFRLQFEDAILHIARLTDSPENNHQQNLSIKRLSTLVSDAGLLRSLGQQIQEAEDRCGFARAYRNKWIAHADFAHRSGTVEALPSVEQSKVTTAISAIRSVVRSVEEHYGVPPTATMDDPWGAKSLIAYLERHSTAGPAA
jgi:hypothetical protein